MSMLVISRFVGRVLRFLGERSGVSTVEYALIVVAVIAIVGGGMALLGGNFEEMFLQIGDDISETRTEMQSVFGDGQTPAENTDSE